MSSAPSFGSGRKRWEPIRKRTWRGMSIPFESGTTISEQKGTILRPCGSVAVRHGPHAFGCSRDLRLGVILAGAVQFALLALFQPIALSIHLQNVHVVGQAIQ